MFRSRKIRVGVLCSVNQRNYCCSASVSLKLTFIGAHLRFMRLQIAETYASLLQLASLFPRYSESIALRLSLADLARERRDLGNELVCPCRELVQRLGRCSNVIFVE